MTLHMQPVFTGEGVSISHFNQSGQLNWMFSYLFSSSLPPPLCILLFMNYLRAAIQATQPYWECLKNKLNCLPDFLSFKKKKEFLKIRFLNSLHSTAPPSFLI